VSVISVVAGKGSPGVTTTALLLAAVWPRPAVFVEGDPSGGDIVFRLRRDDGSALAGDRGVVSLATALRVPATDLDLTDHVQLVDGGLPVLVGVASPAHANALAGSWRGVADALAGWVGGDVFVDCGRLSGEVASRELLQCSARVVVVCRATPAGVAHTRSALEVLRAGGDGPSVSVLVIGDSDAPTQVGAALRGFGELDVIGPLASDPDAAQALAGRWTRRLDRSALVVSARLVARMIDARLPRPATAAVQVPTPELPLSLVGEAG
jgi:MinD-like ATPase involved in chromosome partitioning or flagellar assembly